MGRVTARSEGLFLDTSYAIALLSKRDKFHSAATELALEIESEDITVVTTRAVIFEIGNALAKPPLRQCAIQLIESLQTDRAVEIVEHNETFRAEAFLLFRNRPDKEWSLTDCLSFIVMSSWGMTQALTADTHFEQAGFHALLRE